MSRKLTQLDRERLSIYKDNSKADWDAITAALGSPNRKAAQKAIRRAISKLALPPPTTGTPATQPQREPQATLPRPKKVAKRSNVSSGRSKTSKQGKNVPIPRKGTNPAIMRNRGSGTRSNPAGGLGKTQEGGLGLGRDSAGEGIGGAVGEGIGGGIGEGEGQGVGEGVGQGSGQGSDRFVVGKPYNEDHDPDYCLSRRESLRGNESSEDESDSEESMDEE